MIAVRDFEELRIRVRRIGAHRYLVAANGMAQGAHLVRISGEPGELREEFNRLIAIETGNAPSGRTDTSTGLRRLGQSVYNLLFDDTLTTCLRDARTQAEEHRRGLRLRFDLPPELHPLPVEALCSPPDQPEQTLALDANLSIARSLPGGDTNHRLPTGKDGPGLLHLLIAIATPAGAGLPRIDVDAELAQLRELSDFVVRTDVVHNATRDDIDNWLKSHPTQPCAILLIAHGTYAENSGEGVILLEAPDGTADPIPGYLLSGMFVAAQQLRLVVLNLCFGARNSVHEPFAGLAQAMIGRGVPAVVAMHGPVTDRAAAVFGPRLLAGISANNPVDEAMTSARHHIAALPGHTAIEWATPMLFLHSGCVHGWLFKARQVLENDEWTDPLHAGEQAQRQADANGGNITPATALAAARFLRLRGDWRRVESLAKMMQPSTERGLLIGQARLESAWPEVDKVCAALVNADAAQAREHLDGVRALLPPVLLRLLTVEITAVEVAHRYDRLCELQEAGDWAAALAEAAVILETLPAGYQDTTIRVGYLTGRQAQDQSRWPDAVASFEECADFADAPVRLAYARGKVAVELGDWRGAEQYFRAAADDDLAGYAAGRAAEDSGEWHTALRCYLDLPDPMLDVAARRHYARAMGADGRGDWTGMIDGFRDLADDFADGEVGRRRLFARAKLAEQRLDWPTVLNLLASLTDDYRAGSAGVLRRTARGALAEADDDWATAAACYGAAELDLAHRYALARQGEQDDDWPAAHEHYAILPLDHRDVRQRIGYAAARAAEQALDWVRAVELYAELPQDFADVPTRSRYATLCSTVAKGQWADAADIADALGDYAGTAILAGYARGRLAEQREDWPSAVVAFESCGEHADAATRAAYARGRQLDAAGQWSAAIPCYEQAGSIAGDIAARVARLQRLRAELPFVEGIAEAVLVADPVALRDPTFPYLALAAAGVTPASPTEEVADAAFTLMERGAISWPERVAWDRLRTPAKRLLVDAWMYPLREPHALGDALSTLDFTTGPTPLSTLCERLPANAPLLALLAGNRAGATTQWRERLIEHPADQDDVHCLGVVSFWHAKDLEDAGAWEHATQVWRIALACLATLLTSDDFWTRWRQARAARYGHAVTPADTRQLRIEFGRSLIAVLTGHAQRHANAGRQPEADRYQDLVFLFEAELDAAQALLNAGGLPLPGGERLHCGPEYLRLVGLPWQFGEFVAQAHQAEPEETDSQQVLLRQLRWAFSSLSAASSFLDHHRFDAALRALPEHHRLRREELPADCVQPASHDPHDCPHCQEFVAENPAYAHLPNRRFQLLRDAVALAVRTRLSIARDLLTGGQPDAAMVELTMAIDLAANGLIGARTKDAAIGMILGRVDALTESRTDDSDVTGFDDAIGLVEKAIAVLGDTASADLTKKLANLLVDRGEWYGSACLRADIPADLARAARELRRALELQPDSTWVRYNLAKGLIYYSSDLPTRNPADVLVVLIEALDAVCGGLDRSGSSRRLLEALHSALEAVEEVLLSRQSNDDLLRAIQSIGMDSAAELTGAERARELAEQAKRACAEGDPIGCAALLIRAVRAAPSESSHRIDLFAALDAVLTELRRRNQR